MDYQDKKVVVIGLAGSGASAVRYLAEQGAKVTATDMKTAQELESVLDQIKDLDVELALGGHPRETFRNADLVVTSPGVPKDATPLLTALAHDVPVVSEIEMAASSITAPIIAVTGSNGKTTVVSLIGEIMKEALGESNVFVGGNIGTPLTDLLTSKREVAAAVVEVSSFQLEFIKNFAPKVALILNVTPDHLDRYRDFDDYADTKWRVFENQTPNEVAVVNVDDPLIADKSQSLKQKVMAVSMRKIEQPGMCRHGGLLVYQPADGPSESLPVGAVKLHGEHNLANVMAATCAARALGATIDHVRATLGRFTGLPHRMELVRERDGVRFFNDSKATNPGAVEAAVKGVAGPVVLLMGGQAKGCRFADLARNVAGSVKQVVVFGEDKEQMREDMNGVLTVSSADDLAEALDAALEKTVAGDSVLLAPGCASFDQFKSYKHRGDTFKRLVGEID